MTLIKTTKKGINLSITSTSIYLLKNDLPSTAVPINTSGCSEYVLNLDSEEIEAKLFIKQPTSNKPAFANLFSEQPNFSNMNFGSNQSTGAVVSIDVAGRTFYLTFGQGFHLLDKTYFEPNFGLRVALNSMDTEQIRSVDTASNKTVPLNTRSQSGLGSKVNTFPIDVDEDMLQAIVGKSAESAFNSRISGKRYALGMMLTADLKLLPTVLKKALTYFKAPLKPELQWVENIVEVTNDKQVDHLNDELVKRLSNLKQKSFYFIEPEVIEMDSIVGYSYEPRSIQNTTMLSISSYLSVILSNEVQLELKHLKEKYKVYAKDEDHVTIKTWQGYECIYGELTYNGEHFAIRNGIWYKLNKDFVKEVNDAISHIPIYSYPLPVYDHKNEGDYNAAVAKNDVNIELLDKKNIHIGGGHSKFEFCDLANTNNGKDKFFDLIHVKHYKGSSDLSHLFSQGLVSGEIFRSSEEAREKIYTNHPNVMPLKDSKQLPNTNDYRIVFAIYGVKKLPSKLPFFSKVNLRNAYRRLHVTLGYEVALAHIDISKKKLAEMNQKKRSSNANTK